MHKSLAIGCKRLAVQAKTVCVSSVVERDHRATTEMPSRCRERASWLMARYNVLTILGRCFRLTGAGKTICAVRQQNLKRFSPPFLQVNRQRYRVAVSCAVVCFAVLGNLNQLDFGLHSEGLPLELATNLPTISAYRV